MTPTDPTTNLPFPPDSIQRILFTAHPVHIYSIPPLTSTRGHLAASWTSPSSPSREIFTARLRILETAIPCPRSGTKLTTHILLLDPTTNALFAAAPSSTLTPAQDSSRFFALRVESGTQKATLGIGFEERALAVDFCIAMQEATKALDLASSDANPTPTSAMPELDFSLKAGETIHVDVGRKGRRRPLREEEEGGGESAERDGRALFSIEPPPAYERGEVRLPPLSERVGAGEGGRSGTPEPGTATKVAELGFDDGEFGEFQ